MEKCTPAQLEALTGLTVENQRAWERADIWNNHFALTKGGQRRFRPADVVYVSTVQILRSTGLDLRACAQAASEALLFIVRALDGRIEDGETPTSMNSPIFVWPAEHSTKFGSLDRPVPQASESVFWVVRLGDLNRAKEYAKFGGTHFYPADLAMTLPQAVRDLFSPQSDETSE